MSFSPQGQISRGRARGNGQPRGAPQRGRGRGRGAPQSRDTGSSSSGRGHGRGTSRPDHAPRNICRFYWLTGSCNMGFECKFKHEIQAGIVESQVDDNNEPDFFSIQGFTQNTGIVRTPRQNMKPHEVHNHLKLFLADDSFSFGREYLKMEGFVRIFGSVNSENTSWTVDVTQKFLEKVINSQALILIGEILRVDNVVTQGVAGLSFQRGYFPLLEFFVADGILKTTMHQNVNKLYTVIDHNYDQFHNNVSTSLESMIKAGNWTPGIGKTGNLNGFLVFKVLGTLYTEYITRFKSAFRQHRHILEFIEQLATSFEIWQDAVSVCPAEFDDPITSSRENVLSLTLEQMGKEIYRLRSVARRECGVADERRRPLTTPRSNPHHQTDFMAQLEQAYVPPGSLREAGARHDNDFAGIFDIRIAPTHAELMSPVIPYLPFFVPGSPHHLPPNSMEKHIDIQFRLLREEMISSIRLSIVAIATDLHTMSVPRHQRAASTTLENLLKTRGGAYRTTGHQGVFFHLYTNVSFVASSAQNRNFFVRLCVDAPPGNARSEKASIRGEFWEHSRRLSNGNLVALVLYTNAEELRVFLGTVVSFNTDIADSSKANPDRIELRVSFFDPEIELYSLRREKLAGRGSQFQFGFLLDTSVLFESVRPFLNTLQKVEPTSIPFGDYIASEELLSQVPVEAPRYARVPGFTYNIESLFPQGNNGLERLNIQNGAAVEHARLSLRTQSRLDPSQADAIIDALKQEVALIQGPPGTGKSFTGKEILRVLFKSKVKPIVLIAFTNHALDHMLRSILDDKITTSIVRFGSRSADERVSKYNLTELERMAGATRNVSLGREYRKMKDIEAEMQEVVTSIELPHVHWSQIHDHLEIHYPEASDAIENPALWISQLKAKLQEEEKENGEWTTVKKGKEQKVTIPETLYGFWRRGLDLDFLNGLITFNLPPNSQNLPEDGILSQDIDSRPEDPRVAFFEELGMPEAPVSPSRTKPRDVRKLLHDKKVWSMTVIERNILADAWEEKVREIAYKSNVEEFKDLRERYQDACQNFNNAKDQARKELLSKTDLIGCTTTGAAKLVSLLTAISPKVLMVEEAGQILEAHTLAALVPSVQHMICIGDPKQLRPTLATYSLSVDSSQGQSLYKFDRSLMERLSDNGFPMSLINVQRRMRPSISRFPRLILYPTLEDNEIVTRYPSVRGVQKDVFFLSHTHEESGEKDSVSKHNSHEVRWICSLVTYFLKQGTYGGQGDIAVLCAYLGQLQKVRAALRKAKLAVTVNERDQEELERQGQDEGVTEEQFQNVEVAKHIRLGTVDTFQGEEAKIVIISLVRNSGDFATNDSSIGFLKIVNRINVALTRAKHGMYILGNSSNLRKDPTWTKILDDLEMQGEVGRGFPVACFRHPSNSADIKDPDQLGLIAPEGGCLERCGSPLPCGHICKAVCHPDINQHLIIPCSEPCPRISCPRKHACQRSCGEECGSCDFPLYNERLPCGHFAGQIKCHQKEHIEEVRCQAIIRKKLPYCEHELNLPCYQDPSTAVCTALCAEPLTCCSKSCPARCHECRSLTCPEPTSLVPLTREIHRPHPCKRLLYCQHPCNIPCSEGHQCNTACNARCWQQCPHQSCNKACSAPCAPCMEPCCWSCEHHRCPVPCGSICARLPCNEPCSKLLSCSHPCPSVCGEPCEQQVCLLCAPDSEKQDIADFYLQRTLAELDPHSAYVSERIITLTCGHAFTVETLDGHCEMTSYYEVDIEGEYKAMKVPQVGYQNPRTCPTCRDPITSPRYGRVTKRATLDILERNVASEMSKTLSDAEKVLDTMDAQIDKLQESIKQYPPDGSALAPEEFQKIVAKRETPNSSRHPLPAHIISTGSLHGFSEEETKAWKESLRVIMQPYKKLSKIAQKKGAHIRTYEAALSTLYRLELQQMLQDPSTISSTPHHQAMLEADRKMGQPPHKADTRFQVDSYLLTVILRLYVVQLARLRWQHLAAIPASNEEVIRPDLPWGSYIEFLLKSCSQDLEEAKRIAQESSAARQLARCRISRLRIEMEQCKQTILSQRQEFVRQGHFGTDERETLILKIESQKSASADILMKVKREYLGSQPAQSVKHLRSASQWFQVHTEKQGELILQELDDLKEYIAVDKGYMPLSAREKEDIVKAFDFGHRGHWYNCENGHTFIITECGGAMELSTCPECGCPIGGSNHQLHTSNARAMEYEQISRQQGSRDPHWAWQQGA